MKGLIITLAMLKDELSELLSEIRHLLDYNVVHFACTWCGREDAWFLTYALRPS